jgi:hypothetical protein
MPRDSSSIFYIRKVVAGLYETSEKFWQFEGAIPAGQKYW